MGRRKRQRPHLASTSEKKSSKSARTQPLDSRARIEERRSRRVRGLAPSIPLSPSNTTQPALTQQQARSPQVNSASQLAIAVASASAPTQTPGSESPVSRRKEAPIEAVQGTGSDTALAEEPGHGTTPHSDAATGASAEVELHPEAGQGNYNDRTENWVFINGLIGLLQQTIEVLGSRTVLQPASTMSVRNAAQELLNRNRKKLSRISTPQPIADSFTSEGNGSTSKIYRDSGFRESLQTASRKIQLFMTEHEEGVDAETTCLLEELNHKPYRPSNDARYEDKTLERKLEQVADKNESVVVHSLHDLLCPAAGDFAAQHHRDPTLHNKYKNLVDQRNEPWSMVPQLLSGFPKPVPDYCVGFYWKAFSFEEWDILNMVPEITFTVTKAMHFPFLTCEVKSHRESLIFAENQNAYSMMVVVSSIVKLFRKAKMENNIHRTILAFSVSFNHRCASLYGYYPVIVGPLTEVYRTKVFDITVSPGTPTHWQSWHFIRNIYEVWAPKHLERLQSAIHSPEIASLVDSRRTSRATPTPSESANNALEQLGLQSSVAVASVRSARPSAHSGSDRRKRATASPPSLDPEAKRVRKD